MECYLPCTTRSPNHFIGFPYKGNGGKDVFAYCKQPYLNQEYAARIWNDIQAGKEAFDYVELKDRLFFFIDKESQEMEILQDIPAHYWKLIMKNKMELKVIFGSMLRKLDMYHLDEMYIQGQYRKRQLNKTPWWEQNKRVKREGATKGETAYPPGHKALLAPNKSSVNGTFPSKCVHG